MASKVFDLETARAAGAEGASVVVSASKLVIKRVESPVTLIIVRDDNDRVSIAAGETRTLKADDCRALGEVLIENAAGAGELELYWSSLICMSSEAGLAGQAEGPDTGVDAETIGGERLINAALFGTVGGNPSEYRRFISAQSARIRAITYINAAGGAATRLAVYRDATISGILGGAAGAFRAGKKIAGAFADAVGGWFPVVINGTVDIPATSVPVMLIGTTGVNETRRLECDIHLPANQSLVLVPVTLTTGLWRIQNLASTFVFGVEWGE